MSVCVSIEKVIQHRKIKDLKYLLIIKITSNKNIEEANNAIKMSLLLAIIDMQGIKNSAERIPIFVHPFLYRALKLNFFLDIGDSLSKRPSRLKRDKG